MLKSINPKSGKSIKVYKTLSKVQIEKRIKKASKAQQIWKNTNLAERTRLMLRAAAILENKKDEFARLMTNEMGKPLAESKSEIDKCAWVCRYYAEQAKVFLKNQFIKTEATKSYIAYKPLGVVLAVMPWNYPFWQVFRFAAPALMAGNAGLLKHASNVTGCALATEKIFLEAGFPKGLFRALPIESKQVKSILKNPIVQGVSLTGSEAAGKAVAKTAGAQLKKSVLELGGSDAYLVLADADLTQASKLIAQSRLKNNGQSCIGAKRIIILEEVYDSFLKLFKTEMRARKMGDPLTDDNCLGPLARLDLRDELHEQVKQSVKKGARCILGGKIPKRNGAYYPASILTDIPKNSPAYKEEFFGPVALVFKAKDELEAIKIANDTSFGLGSGVFTKNIKRGEDIARNYLEAGSSFVNSFVTSDPRLPFGGIKNSGYGRELSHLGIREFTNIKTIYIA